MKGIRKLLDAVKNEKGQTMIEYALVAVLIAIVLVFVFRETGVGPGLSAGANRVASALQ